MFLSVVVKIPGVSRLSLALMLCYSLGLMGILTPYATGPAPIYYVGGYIKGKDFWVFGLILGLIFFLTHIAITLPWLRFLQM